MAYKKNTVYYEPIGVVAACVSWNYPFHNFMSPIISALFAGNGIVLKPSEQTAWSSQYFLDIVHGALTFCGHDPSVAQSVLCWPETADYLTSHPGLSHIIFIGSRPVAHKILVSAAKSLTPVTLELGGKDPAIVLDDRRTMNNLHSVADILLRGVFQSAGQNCIGIERIIALPGVHDKLLDIVLQKVRSLRVGHPLFTREAVEDNENPSKQPVSTPDIDMGSLISSATFPKLNSLIDAAVSQGAILHIGGRPFTHPDYPNGFYYQPTLLSNVQPHMAIAREELFAPVFLLMRAASVTEAIKMANLTIYSLGASVFGHKWEDVDRCVQEINAGMVSVNDMGSYYAVSLPFGGGSKSYNARNDNRDRLSTDDISIQQDTSSNRGAKGYDNQNIKSSNPSGYGRFSSIEGLRSLCNIKSVCRDRRFLPDTSNNFFFDFLLNNLIPSGPRTTIPPPLRYPVSNIHDEAWRMCQAVVWFGYGIHWWEKLGGLAEILMVLWRDSGRPQEAGESALDTLTEREKREKREKR